MKLKQMIKRPLSLVALCGLLSLGVGSVANAGQPKTQKEAKSNAQTKSKADSKQGCCSESKTKGNTSEAKKDAATKQSSCSRTCSCKSGQKAPEANRPNK